VNLSYKMQENVFNIIDGLIEGENNFLTMQALRLIPYGQRASIIDHYLRLHDRYIETVNTVVRQNTIQRATNSILTYTFPLNVPSTFQEPVIVAPTVDQISNAVQEEPNPTGSCAICQEQVSSSAWKLRHCGHVFHRSCISQWFQTSVRCPVCRHDIREHSASQTSSASTRTTSPDSDQ